MMSTNVTGPDVVPAEPSLAVKVMEAVAAAKGVDVLSLETTLYEVVDPDALEQLFAPLADGTPRIGGRLSLAIDGLEVVVEADGNVTVSPLPVSHGSTVPKPNER